jgi:hypothetical protein
MDSVVDLQPLYRHAAQVPDWSGLRPTIRHLGAVHTIQLHKSDASGDQRRI